MARFEVLCNGSSTFQRFFAASGGPDESYERLRARAKMASKSRHGCVMEKKSSEAARWVLVFLVFYAEGFDQLDDAINAYLHISRSRIGARSMTRLGFGTRSLQSVVNVSRHKISTSASLTVTP